jgi:multidrug efflux pump subunit AcrB
VRLLQSFFDGFNHLFERAARAYGAGVRALAGTVPLVLGVFVLLIGGTLWLLLATPRGFIPLQDRGYVGPQHPPSP